MTPKLVSPGASTEFTEPAVLGWPRLGWFNMLKNSTRNSEVNRSVIFVFLVSERSTFSNPGPTSAFRFIVPKRPVGVNSKQLEVTGNVVPLHTVGIPLLVNHCMLPA